MTNLRLIEVGDIEWENSYMNTKHKYKGQKELCKIKDVGQVRLEANNTVTIVLNKRAKKEIIKALQGGIDGK